MSSSGKKRERNKERKERKQTNVRIPMESWTGTAQAATWNVEQDDAGRGPLLQLATENRKEALDAKRVCQARLLPWDETEVF